MHTNQTPHYNLPQFVGSDVPNILTDFNDAVDIIDTALYEIKEQADQIDTDVTEEQNKIADLQTQANLTDDNITVVSNQTAAARSEASQAQQSANDNAANISTMQTAVNNNTSALANYNTRFNSNVPFKFGIEEVEDPDNPGSMIEAYGYYTNDDPSVFVAFGEAARESMYKIFHADSISLPSATGTSTYNINIDLSQFPIDITDVTIDNFIVSIESDTSNKSSLSLSNLQGAAANGYLWSGKTLTNNTLTVDLHYAFSSLTTGTASGTLHNVNVYFAKNITDLTS